MIPYPVELQPLQPPVLRDAVAEVMIEYPEDQAFGVTVNQYLPRGAYDFVSYRGGTEWVDGCELPSPGGALFWDTPGVAWDTSGIFWDAGGVPAGDDCLPPTVGMGEDGRFVQRTAASTVLFIWHDSWWFFWFSPLGVPVLTPPPDGDEPECWPIVPAVDPECLVPGLPPTYDWSR